MAWNSPPQAENKWFEVSYEADPRSQRCQVFLMTSHSSHDDLSSFEVWTKIIHICNVLLFLFVNSNQGYFGGWIGGSEVKSKGCSHRGLRLVANTHILSSQWLLTPAPGDPRPLDLSGRLLSCTHIHQGPACAHTCRCTHLHFKLIK